MSAECPRCAHSNQHEGVKIAVGRELPVGAHPLPRPGSVGYQPLMAATAVMGADGGVEPKDPLKGLLEKLKMPPSAPTIR